MERKPIVIDAPWSSAYKEGQYYNDAEADQDVVRLTTQFGNFIELPYIKYLETCILNETDNKLGLESMVQNHFVNSTIFNPAGECVYDDKHTLLYKGAYLKRNDKYGNVDVFQTRTHPMKEDILCHIVGESLDF